MIPMGIIWRKEREGERMGFSAPLSRFSSVDWALKDILDQKGYICMCEQGMDIFLLFLDFVLPPFGL